jgi:DNA-binding CsgD family transcriptional regulator
MSRFSFPFLFCFCTPPLFFFGLILTCSVVFLACRKTPDRQRETFFEQKNKELEGGDYIATYPLANADSCLMRLKAEVPASWQPLGCAMLWYHIPRTSREVSMRMLDLYDEHYPHDTVTLFTQVKRAEWWIESAQFDSATWAINEVLAISNRLNRHLEAADALLLRARIHTYRSNTPAGIADLLQALNYANKVDTAFGVYHELLYIELATAYERQSDYVMQRTWLTKAWHADHSRVDNPTTLKLRVAHGLAISYLRSKPDSSLYWAQQMVQVDAQKTRPTTFPYPRLQYTLARAYFVNNMCDTALTLFQSAFAGTSPQKLFTHYQISRSMGECFLCVGRLDSAEYYLRYALASPDTINIYEAQRILGRVLARQGRWQAAYSAADSSNTLYRRTLDTERIKAAQTLNVQYETALREQKIANLKFQQNQARLRFGLLALASLLLLTLAAGLYARFRNQKLVHEQEKLLLQKEKEITNLRLLQQAQTLTETREELNKTQKLVKIKNQIIETLKMGVPQSVEDPVLAFNNLRLLTKSDWTAFKSQFQEQYPNFTNSLTQQFPHISDAELRLAQLIKLQFSNAEIANILGISTESVMRTRRRLKQKLALSDSTHLDTFLNDFG